MAGAYKNGDNGPAVDGHGIARQGKGEDMAAPARLSGPDAVKGPADCADRTRAHAAAKPSSMLETHAPVTISWFWGQLHL